MLLTKKLRVRHLNWCMPLSFSYETVSSGSLRLLEKVDFDQSDLVTEDVMILDSGEEIYNWVGSGANEEETKKALALSKVNRHLGNTYFPWIGVFFLHCSEKFVHK